MRFTEAGRSLLRLFEIRIINEEQRRCLLEAVPSYQVHQVAQVARECANAWQEFVEQFERGASRAS